MTWKQDSEEARLDGVISSVQDCIELLSGIKVFIMVKSGCYKCIVCELELDSQEKMSKHLRDEERELCIEMVKLLDTIVLSTGKILDLLSYRTC
jgi:hypothetical protein